MLLTYTRTAYSLIGKPPFPAKRGRGLTQLKGWARLRLNGLPKQGDRTFVRKRTTKITIIEPRRAALGMAVSKTGSFWLTESMTGAAATAGIITGTLDLGAYVDVGDQQAVAVEQVDFIWQRYDTTTNRWDGNLAAAMSTDGTFDAQLSDLNPGAAILRADDNSLIASGTLLLDDGNNVSSHSVDFYPDTFGKLDESRMVVNDNLYFTGDIGGTVAADMQIVATVRVKARIVKLSTKDWMALAIQSVASDN